MSFEEALSGFGFHAGEGRAPRGAKLFTAEPNRYLTDSVQYSPTANSQDKRAVPSSNAWTVYVR